MTPKLVAFTHLEQAAIILDDIDDKLADRLRDLMDPLWYTLSPDEIGWLNARDKDECRNYPR